LTTLVNHTLDFARADLQLASAAMMHVTPRQIEVERRIVVRVFDIVVQMAVVVVFCVMFARN
jgi:lipopolysaccharide/colanic/teichoic acid biosynthesis glycosyltransferase